MRRVAMDRKRVLVFIVSYNAERFIEAVLDRIPEPVWENPAYETEVLVIDDSSRDRTFEIAEAYGRRHGRTRLTVLSNPKNQGYGGNQKIGFHYAIEHGHDVVVLLHGDGQYAPELLPEMIEPLLGDGVDVVLGSRMLRKRDALKGGMPVYKWIGNQILTRIENALLGSNLAEFHTGYRAYGVAALASIPFARNSDYYDFDTDILIQMIETKKRIVEIPIPTFYGDEISHVDGLKYARLIVGACLLARVQKLGIYYHPKFDYEGGVEYRAKLGYPSSHQYAVDRVPRGAAVLDVGRGFAEVRAALTEKGARVVEDGDEPDVILALDVIEHAPSPEALLDELRDRFGARGPRVILTTPNVAFGPVRLSLLLGKFNYGKRGILDMTHRRLFTAASLRRMLELHGYDVLETAGIPAPFPLAIGEGRLGRALLALNGALIRAWPGLFAYQIASVAVPRRTLAHLLEAARGARRARRDALGRRG
jgi:glycosyltransferase involved in cell wall biosynthesis